MSWQQKLTKRRLLGRTFVKKKRNWMDFGIPGEAIGKALGGILDQKKGNKKNMKKKDGRCKASAGHADPGKEGLEGQTSKIQHAPNPSFGDGRADWTAERNHRPPIHSEGLVRMPWAGQGNGFLFFLVGMRLTLYRFFLIFCSILGQKRAKFPKET